ncbi:MAG: SGNH/GDSL hydrolase family protein [Cyanobacterium sp.]
MILKVIIASVFTTAFFALFSVKAQSPYTDIYVFGDSLSDTGNLAQIVHRELGQSIDFPPSEAYPQGRFTNEFVWVEILAQYLGITVNPATNFAIASAQSGLTNFYQNDDFPEPIEVRGVLGQVQHHPRAIAPEKHLYIILGGANDYLSPDHREKEPEELINHTINNLRESILLLIEEGAENIMVANLPALGQLPATIDDPEISTALNALSSNHNNRLKTVIDEINQDLDKKIKILDLETIFKEVTTYPEEFGLVNTTQGCLMIGCENPDQFLFWDEIHPTARTHQIMADFALQLIGQKKAK